MAAFTSETKLGYFDGEHIGNWGDGFPIFARVMNGQVYAVGREDNPNNPDPTRFGNMYYIGRLWLRNNLFAATPSDADYFVDKPHNLQDTSVPGSMFNRTANTNQVISRPDPTATTSNPTPTTTTPTTTTPTTTTPTTTPATTTPGTTTTGSSLVTTTNSGVGTIATVTKQLSTTTIILIAAGVVVAIAGIMYFMKAKK